MENRITPELINSLGKNDIFVFGSNESGLHGAGAAKFAEETFGAFMGQGFGIMNKSFGIPTKDWDVKTLPISVVKFYVDRFIAYAKSDSRCNFFVTKIGCGLAGFTEEEIAPLFEGVKDIKNIYLPQSFWEILEKIEHPELNVQEG